MTHEQLERQVHEMWDAINNIPDNDPDKQFAINQASQTEAMMRAMVKKQYDPIEFVEWIMCNAEQWGDEWVYNDKQYTTKELFEKYLSL